MAAVMIEIEVGLMVKVPNSSGGKVGRWDRGKGTSVGRGIKLTEPKEEPKGVESLEEA